MLRIFVLAGVTAVTACAAPAARQAATEVAPPPGMMGRIVAMRPVPDSDSPPLHVLLGRLGADSSPTGAAEFIVQTDDGTVLAVVQPSAPELRPGARVAIVRGIQTRIRAVPPPSGGAVPVSPL